jgi:lysophospholipid acyltransferase
MMYIHIAGFAVRFKFYGVWELANGACVLSGLGYEGVDKEGKAKW